MRISEIDLQCEDIMWFGVDINGNIFECTSAGIGNVPEYVCRSWEETNALIEYFMEKAPVITKAQALISSKQGELYKDVTKLASKGIFCFDLTDYEKFETYNLVAKPEKPVNIAELPEDIQEIMSDHLYSGDVTNVDAIIIE